MIVTQVLLLNISVVNQSNEVDVGINQHELGIKF